MVDRDLAERHAALEEVVFDVLDRLRAAVEPPATPAPGDEQPAAGERHAYEHGKSSGRCVALHAGTYCGQEQGAAVHTAAGNTSPAADGVRALHRKAEDGRHAWCEADGRTWPCPTVQTLDAAGDTPTRDRGDGTRGECPLSGAEWHIGRECTDACRAVKSLVDAQQPGGADVDTGAIRALHVRDPRTAVAVCVECTRNLCPGELAAWPCNHLTYCDALDARDAENRELRAELEVIRDSACRAHETRAWWQREGAASQRRAERAERQASTYAEHLEQDEIEALDRAIQAEQQRDDARGLAAALEAELARVRAAVNVDATPALIAEILDEALDG